MTKFSAKNFEKFAGETLPLLKQASEQEKIPVVNMPVNDSSDVVFSGYNKTKLMLSAMANGFEDNRWITEKQLQEKYPELSIPENAQPTNILRSTKSYFEKDEDGKAVSLSKEEFDSRRIEASKNGEKANAFYAFEHNAYNIYNASQIPNYPKQENSLSLAKKDVYELIDNFIASSGVKVVHSNDKNFYNYRNDTIEADPNSFKSKDDYYAKLLENFFYATTNENRENRPINTTKEVLDEHVKTTTFAMLVSAQLGLDTTKKYAENIFHLVEKNNYPNEELMKSSYEAQKILSTFEQFATGDTVRANWFPHNSEWHNLIEKQKEVSKEQLSSAEAPIQKEKKAEYIEPNMGNKLQYDVEKNTSHPIVIRLYLDIPKAEKEEAKVLGAKWDNNEKSWFTMSDNPNNNKLMEKWKVNEEVKNTKIYLNVSKEEKDEAKALGAKWDSTQKAWFTTADNPNNKDLMAKWAGTDNQKPTEDKIYLSVSKEEKDFAKALGAKWDNKEKMWFTTANNPNNSELFDKYSAKENMAQAQKAEKIYINVPREEKEDAKALGAKWDRKAVSWYTTNDNPKNDSLFSLYTKQDTKPLSADKLEETKNLFSNPDFVKSISNKNNEQKIKEALNTLGEAVENKLKSSSSMSPKMK